MKRLLLLRHAKSSWHDPGLKDFDRPLNRRGRKAAGAMGDYLRKQGPIPDLVLCSAAQRSRETLAFIQDRLDDDLQARIMKTLYGAGPRELAKILKKAAPKFDTLMIIGHHTGLEDFAALLARNGNKKARKRLVEKFPTGAMAVIGISGAGWHRLDGEGAELLNFVCPRDLES